VQALRAEKIVLEDRLAKVAAELAASKQALDVATDDLRTVNIRLTNFLNSIVINGCRIEGMKK
jgi:hypothetical protein